MRYRTRVLAIAGTAMVVVGGVIFALRLSNVAQDVSYAFLGRPFESQVWRSADTDFALERGNMIGDLVEHHLARGMYRRDLEQLLDRANYREAGGRRLIWTYGVEEFFLDGWGYLTIYLDRQNRVTGWEQYVDE